MKRGVIIVAVVVVLFFAAFYAAAKKMQSLTDDSYGGSYVTTSALSPDWEDLYRYESQGAAGFPGLERLMASSDSGVASTAARRLARDSASYDRFFSGIVTVQPLTKASIGMDNLPLPLWYAALDIINDQESELREGAALFIRVAQANSPVARGAWLVDEFPDALVSSITNAEGAYAESLAMTISMYPPNDDAQLLALLDSGNPAVRKIVVQTLGKFGREKYLDALRKLETDPDSEVRQAVAVAERTIGVVMRDDSGNSNEKLKKRLGMP